MLPRHGQFSYLSETFMLCHTKSEVKIEYVSKIWSKSKENWTFHKIWVKSSNVLGQNCVQWISEFLRLSKQSLIRFQMLLEAKQSKSME